MATMTPTQTDTERADWENALRSFLASPPPAPRGGKVTRMTRRRARARRTPERQ